jgi:hypothetical protein
MPPVAVARAADAPSEIGAAHFTHERRKNDDRTRSNAQSAVDIMVLTWLCSWLSTASKRVMPPERKETCDCGHLERASKEPDHAIRWDEKMNEYYIAYGKGGKMCVYYCPFCGGRTPESRRDSFFAHVTDAESARIYGLFRGIRTVSDVVAKFGPPDEEREQATGVRHPEKDGRPGRGEVFRSMIYKNLSPVAEVWFDVGINDCVQGHWLQKYLGEKK